MSSFANRNSQRGAAMLLVVFGMLAILAMAGLALDSGHLFLSKTRLQNMVDSAALAGAKTLDQYAGETSRARQAAKEAFSANAAAEGHQEIADAFSADDLVIEFSDTVNPFVAGGSGRYIRVKALGVDLPSWIVQIIGVDDLAVSATAVAGPSVGLQGKVCNVIPVMVCGDPLQNPASGAETFWGYEKGAIEVLKTVAVPKGPKDDWATLGPGNFQLINPGDGDTGALLRAGLAGDYADCADLQGGVAPSKPGNTAGPTRVGINTRFGIYDAPFNGGEYQELYPPDVVTTRQSVSLSTNVVTEGDWQRERVFLDGVQLTAENVGTYANDLFTYDDYLEQVRTESGDFNPDGVFDRRKVVVPVVDCTGKTPGASDAPVMGLACFFLLDPLDEKGGNNDESRLYGEFLENCSVNGVPGNNPEVNSDVYRIQLYDDSASKDS